MLCLWDIAILNHPWSSFVGRVVFLESCYEWQLWIEVIALDLKPLPALNQQSNWPVHVFWDSFSGTYWQEPKARATKDSATNPVPQPVPKKLLLWRWGAPPRLSPRRQSLTMGSAVPHTLRRPLLAGSETATAVQCGALPSSPASSRLQCHIGSVGKSLWCQLGATATHRRTTMSQCQRS